MGNFTITIHGVGAHHNEAVETDANRMAAEFADKLRAAGHNIEHVSFTHGGREDLLSGGSYTRAKFFPSFIAKAALLAVAGLMAIGLVACSAAQVQTAQTDIAASVGAVQAACKDALAAAQLAGSTVKGGAAQTVSSISGYVTAGCATAQAVAALAASSSSVQWLGQQQGALQAITAQAAAPTAPAS